MMYSFKQLRFQLISDSLPVVIGTMAIPLMLILSAGIFSTQLLAQSLTDPGLIELYATGADHSGLSPLIIIGAIAIFLMLIVAFGMFGIYWLVAKRHEDEFYGGAA